MSQITTHILDTTLGRPAQGVAISLHRQNGENWEPVASGITNQDGRIGDLLEKEVLLPKGFYKMRFELEAYFDRFGKKAFYPFVEIVFLVDSREHYHIPLLLNPYGYSTYRGS
ncbi:MAG: hydroxyisourate hydrolase [Bacteroidetes bacterium]|nr:hydroxyisourate hydrolase [Bacteroidota bacterium]